MKKVILLYELRNKMSKNAKNSIKSSGIAVFRLLVNKQLTKINQKIDKGKMTKTKNGKQQYNKPNKLEMDHPLIYI